MKRTFDRVPFLQIELCCVEIKNHNILILVLMECLFVHKVVNALLPIVLSKFQSLF